MLKDEAKLMVYKQNKINFLLPYSGKSKRLQSITL
jgi:hypothetical protein